RWRTSASSPLRHSRGDGRFRRDAALRARALASRSERQHPARRREERRPVSMGGGAIGPMGGGAIGPMARSPGDGHEDVLLQSGVAGWVVGGSGLPAAPDDAGPGTAEGAQRAAVVVPAL